MATNTGFLNRNNTIDIVLSNDGVAINHALVTRILLVFDAQTLDSQVTPALFDLTNSAKIIFKPATSGLPVGVHGVTIITYDVSNPLGVVWNDINSEKITIKQI